MRNIFLFIRRYFNFFLFLILQAICIYLIVNYSKYHQAAFGNKANIVTGKVNKEINKIEDFFYLQRANDSLLKANERLYNMLKANYNLPDSSTRIQIDSFKIDSIQPLKNYRYLSAKVIANSVVSQSNSLVLYGSNIRQCKADMGVVDINNAIVGVITTIDDDYAVVMSLLHKDSRTSGKLLKTGETGTISWDGNQPNIVQMHNIPKSTKVAKGDTVISSGFSTRFPKGLMIGRVHEVMLDKASNNYLLKIKTAANFYNLQYGYVMVNSQQEKVKNLLEKTKSSQE